MKKTFLFALILIIFYGGSAQTIEWKKIDDKKDKYDFNFLFKLQDQTNCAVFTIPDIKPFKPIAEEVFVRAYNADFTKYSQVSIPPESPNQLNIRPFKKHIIISGSDTENKGPFKTNYEKNRYIITDLQLNPLINMEIPKHNVKNAFEGTPDLFFNNDSSCFIFVSYENPYPGRPSPKTNTIDYNILVINDELKQVWSGYLNFDEIFGKGIKIDGYKFEYINNRFYLIASTQGSKIKKIQPTIFLVEFDDKGAHNIVHKEVFVYTAIYWEILSNKNKHMVIGGFYKTKNTNLFFLKFDFNSQDLTPEKKTVLIDKVFIKQSAEHKLFFISGFYYPFHLIPIQDGYIWLREDHSVYTRTDSRGNSSTSYILGNINLLKFDKNFNLIWFKRISKRYSSSAPYYSYFCSPFVQGNKLHIFYYDFDSNIKSINNSPKPKLFSRNLCLAMAKVSEDGEIEKDIVYSTIDQKIMGSSTYMYPFTNSQYIIRGNGITLKDRGSSYVGIIDVNDK